MLIRIALFLLSIVFMSLPAGAQDAQHSQSHHGINHQQWHADFYNKLQRPGNKGSCCNLTDCRPTSLRTVGDHYEIMKDGRWIRVDPSTVIKDIAPDGGPHICAPPSESKAYDADFVFCVVMPMEG